MVPPKKLLLDLRTLAGRSTGIGRYVTNLVREIIALAPEGLALHVLCAPGDKVPEGITRHVLDGIRFGIRPMSPLQQLVLPWSVRTSECDLYHYPFFDPPWAIGRPFVATCYDMEPLRHPELFPARISWYYRLFATGLRRAERVIVISENTGRDLIEFLRIAPERVRVIYLGVDPSFRPVDSPWTFAKVRQQYLLHERYILYLGNTMPHKNLPRLIDAMAYVHQQEPDVVLLLAGCRDKYRPAVEQAIATTGLANVVRFLGCISEEDLPVLLSGAQVFAYPSLYEGFGLPVLEAMACGTPVVTSNRSSLPEVVRDSAVVVNPEDSREIAEGVLRLLRNPTEAKRFANAGLQRARQFTWQRCAEQHIEVYREVLEG